MDPASPAPHHWRHTAPPATAGPVPHLMRWEPSGVRDISAIRRTIVRALTAGTPPCEPDTVEDLLMIVDELLSNGLRHGLPPVTLQLQLTTSGWLVTVIDHATTSLLAPTSSRDPALGGMGLGMVAQVATATGWLTDTSTKLVWALITPA